MRILVIEDSPRLRQTVSTALRRSGYAVDVSGDGEDGLWQASSNDYDVVVLDVMLPKRGGLEVLRALRADARKVHVLLLTARDTVADRVSGLQAGADDYLVKPFALEELLARVQALCRRAYGTQSPRLVLQDLEIDSVARSVSRAGKAVELTAREYQLLEYLARRRGQVVTRSEIEAHIYDDAVDPMSNVVDSAVCSLRKKIAVGAASAPLIHTRRGFGYVMDPSPAAAKT
jgi:DNA-binding response OmpR family regulator